MLRGIKHLKIDIEAQMHRGIGPKHHEARVEKHGQPDVDNSTERRAAGECRLQRWFRRGAGSAKPKYWKDEAATCKSPRTTASASMNMTTSYSCTRVTQRASDAWPCTGQHLKGKQVKLAVIIPPPLFYHTRMVACDGFNRNYAPASNSQCLPHARSHFFCDKGERLCLRYAAIR